MKYILYFYNGFVKKHPLAQKEITIGRSQENTLSLNDALISRFHARLTLNKDNSFLVEDLNSTNGIVTADGLKKKCTIQINESFILGNIEFYYKEGSPTEFKYHEELEPILSNLKNSNSLSSNKSSETINLQNIYKEILKTFIKKCFKKNNFPEVIAELINILSNISYLGNFYLISEDSKQPRIHFSVENNETLSKTVKNMLKSSKDLFKTSSKFYFNTFKSNYYYSYITVINFKKSLLLFFPRQNDSKIDNNIHKFLSSLSKEIELFSKFFSENKNTNNTPEKNRDLSRKTHSFDIITNNPTIKSLIQQAKKIAQSDLFILISGESGTGKELFTKIIHYHSQRQNNKLIAINCAAIPMDLLESEFFGHEKGAFTSAEQTKIGKLELASGGTLVLDEIGDMPLQLQPKLLRAIQENEFYRVGGTQPIKVDLRIISSTNQNLKDLIDKNLFREDLYYRLVHRVLPIPPLRERIEDIPLLIDYFAHKYVKNQPDGFKGFSLMALDALKNFTWKGNIRQLENEIRSIVNLIEVNEKVTLDMLSDDIRKNYLEIQGKKPNNLTDSHYLTKEEYLLSPHNKDSNNIIMGYLRRDKSAETEIITKILRKNSWNKSQTARDLNITYQGLHKKMKKLNIIKPKDYQ